MTKRNLDETNPNFTQSLWCPIHGNLAYAYRCGKCSTQLMEPKVFDPPEVQRINGVYDTCEIAAIYLQRPQTLADISLKKWFFMAHQEAGKFFPGEQLKDLMMCSSLLETKRTIVKHGMNAWNLEPLYEFNKRYSKRELTK